VPVTEPDEVETPVNVVTPGGPSRRTRLVFARDDRVVGEFPVQDRHRDAGGSVQVGILFVFAADLIEAGCRQRTGEDGVGGRVLDAKSLYLIPSRTNQLTGEATPVATSGGLVVWKAMIRAEDGQTIAEIVQTIDWPEPAGALGRTARPDRRLAVAPAEADAETPVTTVASRRERILAAATEVIGRKGFANATIREIADEAGMHVPTLYQYVVSKDELLELVYKHEQASLKRDLDVVSRKGGSATEKLAEMLSVALSVSDQRRRQIGILNRELKNLKPDARARMLTEYRSLVRRYETEVAAGIQSGEFRRIDPLIAANFIDMAADIWALRQFFFSDYALDDYRQAAIALVLSGLKAGDDDPAE